MHSVSIAPLSNGVMCVPLRSAHIDGSFTVTAPARADRYCTGRRWNSPAAYETRLNGACSVAGNKTVNPLLTKSAWTLATARSPLSFVWSLTIDSRVMDGAAIGSREFG